MKQQGEQFKKKRQQFEINLRKNNREQIIMKRRNIEEFMNKQSQSIDQEQKIIIVDHDIADLLKPVLVKKYQYKDIESLVQSLYSNDMMKILVGVIGLRKLSRDPTEKLTDYFLGKGNVKKLVQLCSINASPQLRFEILWLFTNLSSFKKQATIEMVQNKLLPILVQSMAMSNDKIAYQAVWTVGNVAAQDTKFRNQLIQYNSVSLILQFIEKAKMNHEIVTSIWALTNLVRGQPRPKYDAVKFAVPIIAQTLKRKIIKNQEVLSDCLWSLANLCDGQKVRIARLMQTNIIPHIMTYLKSQNLCLLIPTLRIIGNFTTGNKQQTNEILKNNFLDYAYQLLVHKKLVIVKQTCWALSNITAGTDQQILQFLQRQDLINRLLQVHSHTIPQIKSQIVWIFTNLERASIPPELVLKIYEAVNLIKMIGQLLITDNNKIVLDALVCLERVLTMGQRIRSQQLEPNVILQTFLKSGYVSVLENLQQNPSDKIYRQCLNIMKRFFNSYQQQ